MTRMQAVTLLDVEIDPIRSDELLDHVEKAVREQRQAVFAYANVHALNLAHQDSWFRDFLNGADVLYTDGEGVRLGAWMLGKHLPEKIALTTWIWRLAQRCEEHGFSMFILGSRQEVADRAAQETQRRYPNLRIVGVHHGFFLKEGVESDQVVREVNEADPDVLLVGFGMPLQEEWISRNRDRLRARAIFTAGSCFEYMAGVRSVCPRWMSDAGLEWLYRLAQEPRRLFFRYVIGNPLFIMRILRQRLMGRRRRASSDPAVRDRDGNPEISVEGTT